MKKTIFTILLIVVAAAMAFNFSADTAAAAGMFSQIETGYKSMANAAYGGEVKVDQYTFANSLIYIINILLTFTGVVFFLLFLYSGYLWMTARGNEEQVKKAKEMMKEIIIGLIIIIIARLFTEFLLTQIGAIITANQK